MQVLEKIRQDFARCEAQLKAAREEAAEHLAARKKAEKQVEVYEEIARQMRAVLAPHASQ